MTKEELINGGYLEAYLTQDLSNSEMEKIEDMLETDMELQRRYKRLQSSLQQLAFTFALRPTSTVKKRMMENPLVMGNAQFKESHKRSRGIFQLMTAASVTIALVSTLSAIYFWNQWQKSDGQLAELTIRNLEMAENYRKVNNELGAVRQDLAVLVSPDFSRILLNGTDNSPEAKAVIYWNQDEVYINSASLAQLPINKQYQLWALIDGVPKDAGIFDAEQGRFQVMKGIAKADAFAVTVEQVGGAKQPTLSTMQVYGET